MPIVQTLRTTFNLQKYSQKFGIGRNPVKEIDPDIFANSTLLSYVENTSSDKKKSVFQ